MKRTVRYFVDDPGREREHEVIIKKKKKNGEKNTISENGNR